MTRYMVRNNVVCMGFSIFLIGLLNYYMQILFNYLDMLPDGIGYILLGLESLIVYGFLRRIFLDWSKYDKYVFASIYILFVLFILLGRNTIGVPVIQLNPFACLREIIYGSDKEWLVFLFNIASFIPIPMVFHTVIKNPLEALFYTILFGICIECVQLITYVGVFDLGDICLYTVGALLGYFCWFKIEVPLR